MRPTPRKLPPKRKAAPIEKGKGKKKAAPSSQTPTLPPPIPIPPPCDDTPRFISKFAKKWYDDHCNNTFVVEKTIDPDIDAHYGVSMKFGILGWENVLQIKGKYYNELVLEFYANVKNRSDEKGLPIRSVVKGKDVEISIAKIDKLLNLTPKGEPVEFHLSQLKGNDTWNKDVAAKRFGVKPDEKLTYKTKFLDIPPRLVAYMLHFNMEPKASSRNELRTQDIFVMEKMFFGLDTLEGIPLSPFIIGAMWDVITSNNEDKAIVFPLIISRLLEEERVDVIGAREVFTTKSDILDARTMADFRYRKQGDWWVNQHLEEQAADMENANANGTEAIDEVKSELDRAVITSTSSRRVRPKNWHEFVDHFDERINALEAHSAQMATTLQSMMVMLQTALDRLPPPPQQ
ncbi:hypothetical protein CCACVL1_23278 [Corchorus capsularis]|uniref:Putative plant transposon protein domain-containing protein n=1 Tax=Corchorus capsularis TaxID=210143 RepID=A0A1R3GUM1_COCAP|nr:hypothetical protein CCACVL1_23278 [Corchorus capsularis]